MTSGYERAGRTSTFGKKLETAADIQALGDRIAQPVGIGARRGELDAVSVRIQERSGGDDNGFGAAFQTVIRGENDVESVTQRVVNTVAIAYQNGQLDGVRVTIVELVDSGDD